MDPLPEASLCWGWEWGVGVVGVWVMGYAIRVQWPGVGVGDRGEAEG